MFPWLGEQLITFFGPFRLLTSYLFLTGLGVALAMLTTWFLLPRLWHLLPRDSGRLHAVGAEQSLGKPVGAGLIFVAIFTTICLLVLPFNSCRLEILACVVLASLVGYADDKLRGGLSELQLGVADLVIALLGVLAFTQLQPVVVWLPLWKTPLTISPWLFIPVATG